MGIDFSHGEAHWGYGGFNRFRTSLGREIGICVELMEGYWSDDQFGSRVGGAIASGKLSLDDLWWFPKEPMSWDKIEDPIKFLLNHSDCDGHIPPGKCAKIAPRLRKLVKDWDKKGQDYLNAIWLAEGMEAAAEAKENLEFC